MSKFEFIENGIKDSRVIINKSSKDSRGDFAKDYEENEFLENGLIFHCTETFSSTSRKDVIRGLHFQTVDPQAKLVHVVYGCVFDVVVDLRKESPSYGKWFGQELSVENHCGIYIPRGCAHGFLSLQEGSIVYYKCDGKYSLNSDSGIVFDDKEIAISWPVQDISKCIVSERDRNLMTFQEFRHVYQGL